MADEKVNQRQLATHLGLDPTTLNNFLNNQSVRLGGLAVALACSIGIDVECNGVTIGKLVPMPNGDHRAKAHAHDAQLVLEFDDNFVLKQESHSPCVLLHKPASSERRIRLRIVAG